jgi:D-amino peptidase
MAYDTRMKVFISADVEGVAGIASWSQILPGEPDYEIGRRLMTLEVNAAIEGAYAAGASHVVVNDAHARMTNLLPEDLDQRARLVSGRFKPLYMMQGLDASFAAVLFIGYHGGIGEPESILSHSYSPRVIWEAKVNGRVAGEIGINALVASHFGVPVVLVSGDQATAAEARATLPDVHVVQTKRSYGRNCAESMSPTESRQEIREATGRALAGIPSIESGDMPATIELTFHLADMADIAQWLPGIERHGSRTIRFSAEDGLTAYRTFYTILLLAQQMAD